MGRLCKFTDPWISVGTLPEIKIARENRPSQKETSIPTIHFEGRAVYVNWTFSRILSWTYFARLIFSNCAAHKRSSRIRQQNPHHFGTDKLEQQEQLCYSLKTEAYCKREDRKLS